MTPCALGLGGAFLYHADEQETIRAIHRALDIGIDFFDTYPGRAEYRWGMALKGRREEVYLQAKVGTHADPADYSGAATRWCVERSLKNLQTDYLDSVLIHDPPDIEDPLATGHALDELLEMKEAGIVRNVGFGMRPLDFHVRAIETGKVDLVLTFMDYTLISQTAADILFPVAQVHDTGIILASVQGMGLLAGPEPDDEQWERNAYPGQEPRAHAIWTWCRERDVNIRALAIQYCLAAPIDGILLAGPADRRQFEEVYDAATEEVPAAVWEELQAEFGVGRGAR